MPEVITDPTENEFTTGINPQDLAPELQTMYKSMQADYTRKTQELASKRKEFDTKTQQYESKLVDYGKLEQETKQWRDWYATLEAQAASEPDDTGIHTDDLIGDSGDQSSKYVEKLQTKISELERAIESTNAALKQSSTQVNRMFNYQTQLNDLSVKHPDLDKDRLLAHAVEIGQTDLRKAYADLYRDDIINAEVEKRLNAALAKRRTDGISSSGQKMILRTAKDTPKTFAEATEQIVLQRASEGKLE